jgi:hypothetical protein
LVIFRGFLKKDFEKIGFTERWQTLGDCVEADD